jgi:hypothetical protein
MITFEMTEEEFERMHEAVDSYVDMIGGEWDSYYEEEEPEVAEQEFASLLGKIIEYNNKAMRR